MGHCGTSECQQPALFLSPPLSTAQLPTACKQSLSDYFPYHISLLIISVQLSGSLQGFEQSTFGAGGQVPSQQTNCSCGEGQHLLAVPQAILTARKQEYGVELVKLD